VCACVLVRVRGFMRADLGVHGWKQLSMENKTLNVSYDAVEDFQFASMGRELEHVVQTLLRKLHRDEKEIPHITELEVFRLFLDPFLLFIANTSNVHLKRDDLLSVDDLERVVIVKTGESYYGRPASVILSDHKRDGDFNALFRVSTAIEHAEIVRRIRVIPGHPDKTMSWNNSSDTVDQLADLELAFFTWFRGFHARGVAVLSLDDDKLRKLSHLFADLGLKRTFTRDSGACPVMHMLASVLTGLVFGGRLDRQGSCLPRPSPEFCTCEPLIFLLLFSCQMLNTAISHCELTVRMSTGVERKLIPDIGTSMPPLRTLSLSTLHKSDVSRLCARGVAVCMWKYPPSIQVAPYNNFIVNKNCLSLYCLCSLRILIVV